MPDRIITHKCVFPDSASSLIQEIEWTSITETEGKLFVTFKSNNTSYCYYKVPENVFFEMLDDEHTSPGRYFCKHIKNKFDYDKLGEEDE